MQDTLKQLLAAEQEANRLTELAANAAEILVTQANEEARAQEQRFLAHLPELRAAFIDKAEQRAAQTLAEMQRRYEERLEQLRQDAEQQDQAALDAAFAELLRVEESIP
ncbi:MAG: ATPase [Gammaproteobacteria bacterium SHHR-1]|jgi:vacuolar-type H+-ATPase subunit H|uniref:ATPase n=1 Tax=Magnetovirga frankeli TaxID=947516 RepID=UPI00129396B3|nr:ATPase [gamma proteobacterium SS-5]